MQTLVERDCGRLLRRRSVSDTAMRPSSSASVGSQTSASPHSQGSSPHLRSFRSQNIDGSASHCARQCSRAANLHRPVSSRELHLLDRRFDNKTHQNR
jgi:hypothetical protein